MTVSLSLSAPAKLNLFLHITGKREDGYHLLESLVIFTQFGDRLEIAPAAELMLDIAGPYATEIPAKENLVLRAAGLLQKHSGYTSGTRMTLHKHIPIAGGLGGGSSDAAAVLKGLITLWGLTLSDEVLKNIALQLGTDVPVCLKQQPAVMRGIGEQILPVSIQASFWLVLVNPNAPLLTRNVYQQFSGGFLQSAPMPQTIGSFGALMDILNKRQNVLETAAMQLLPVIDELLSVLRLTEGCRLARMSGSGATCFGIYARQQEAERAANSIQKQHPAWWCKVTHPLEEMR